MTNIPAGSIGVKPIQEPSNSTQNKEQSTPDVFKFLLAELSRGIREHTSTQQGDKNLIQQNIEVEYGLLGNVLVRYEDVLLTLLPASGEHADSFSKIGIFGHQQKTLSEEGKHVGIAAESSSKRNFSFGALADNIMSSHPLVNGGVIVTNDFLKDFLPTDTLQRNNPPSMSSADKTSSQKKTSSKIGVNYTLSSQKNDGLFIEYKVAANNLDAAEISKEQVNGEAEAQSTERNARTESVYRAVAHMPNSQVHIALYALERGLRLFARVSDLSDSERSELRGKIDNILAQYGMSGTEVIIENYSDLSLNERTK